MNRKQSLMTEIIFFVVNLDETELTNKGIDCIKEVFLLVFLFSEKLRSYYISNYWKLLKI